jgi:hypothetical protein
MLQEGCLEYAQYLMQIWPKKEDDSSLFDETIDACHSHHLNGELEIATNFADYTSYHISIVDGSLQVIMRQLDNYKLHDRAKIIEVKMDDGDWQDLHDTLSRLNHEYQSMAALENLDLKPIWNSLLDALFIAPHFGESPTRAPKLEPNPTSLAHALTTTLKKAKRLAEWEWKELEQGVMAVQQMAPVKTLKLTLTYPSEAEKNAIFESDDFSADILSWFDAQLSPHGMTLIAITPIDESQNFALVPISRIAQLINALNSLCIHHLVSPQYFE